MSRNVKEPDGKIKRKRKPVGKWGVRKNLYSDSLEAKFQLLEGDAVRPIEMLLNVEPLNQPQRESLVGFIVIQRLRNPYFMGELRRQMTPIVAAKVGGGKENDDEYMRAVYESSYDENEFYDKIARPIFWSRWAVVRSEYPFFVLPDRCNVFGDYEGKPYVLMPLTPTDCLLVLPFSDTEIRIVPHYIQATPSLAKEISNVLIAVCK